jgi:putative transposase
MPWEQPTVTDKKIEFVFAYEEAVRRSEGTMSSVCKQFGISRKTGYAIIAAYRSEGWSALEERSRAPRSGRHWAEPETIQRVLDTRIEFPEWGAKKIVAYLRDVDPAIDWPVPSVAHDWMRRAGMIAPRFRSRRYPHPGPPPAVAITRPNQQWSVDFKGEFRTRDRNYCYPLTVLDSYSRFLIGCDALRSTSFELAWPVFERLFREYGLPDSILSDNGTPFSSRSVRRLSTLAVRLLRLGVAPVLIEPGRPYQNGRHERMHGDLKVQACNDPAESAVEQQLEFDAFRHKHNVVRPHESLGQKPPARCYSRSPRVYPPRLPEISYPNGMVVRRVRSNGQIKWKTDMFFVSEVLIGEPVAFERVGNSTWILRYATLEIGYYSERDNKLHLNKQRPDGKAEN